MSPGVNTIPPYSRAQKKEKAGKGYSMKTRRIKAALLVLVFAGAMGVSWIHAEDAEPVLPEDMAGIFEEEVMPPAEDDGRAFTKVAESGDLELLVLESGREAGEFQVLQKSTGMRWYSNPPTRFDDSGMKGVAKMATYSQFLMSYYDEELKTEKTVNSYTGASRSGGIIIRKIENGLKIIYRFEDQKIAVPLYVLLENGSLIVRVSAEEIVEQGTCYVLSLSLMPYLGSTGVDDDGFLFVPDGSGGIIEFNNGEKENAYKQPVYGEDPAFATDNGTYISRQAHLPVFGLSRTQGAYIGVISKGAASASVNGFVSGLYNTQNNVYASFVLRNQGRVSIGDSSSSISASAIHYDTEHRQVQECAVTYVFLKPKASYSDMAARYQQFLSDNAMLPAESHWMNSPALVLEFFAGTVRQENILGIPVDRYTVMTTFDQAEQITANFRAAGVQNVTAIMRNADSAEASGKFQNKVRLQSGLGGKKSLLRLASQANAVYLTYRPLSITSGGNGIWKVFDIAKRFDRNPMKMYSYKISTLYRDVTAAPRLLMRPDVLASKTTSYASSLSKLKGIAAAAVDIGTLLYGSYDGSPYTTRTQAVQQMTAALKSLGGVVYAPNDYALASAQCVVDLPCDDSEFDIVDYEIPFYQMVLSGRMDFAHESANIDGDMQRMLLKSAETGASLKLTLIMQNVTKTTDTPYAYLGGTDYSARRNEYEEMQIQLQKLFDDVGSRTIREHNRVADGVFRTTYESGKSVIVNYTDADVQTPEGTVKAQSWLLIN